MPKDYKAITQIWQPYSTVLLSEEDGREIAQNVKGFFDVLARWEAADEAADQAPTAVVVEDEET